MQISIHLFATYRNLIGKGQFFLDLPKGGDIQTAIDLILSQHPTLKGHWCNPAGELMPHLFVILNKQDIASLPDGLNTILKEGDELDFVPPVGGG
jgi:MoaD family protein